MPTQLQDTDEFHVEPNVFFPYDSVKPCITADDQKIRLIGTVATSRLFISITSR